MFWNKQKKWKLTILLTAVALAVLTWPAAATAQEVNDVNLVDPNLPDELQMPGTIEGTGTYFEVTDSNYLNITLESSEPVNLRLESVPEMIVMDVNSAEGAASTQITLTGFPPSTTYYKYEDDYHNGVSFTTDDNGSYTYAQDLSQPHLVFIQPQAGTKFIRDDATGGDATSIGTWDWATKTCTLTQDVYETIQIDSDGITLDGDGHTVTGSGFGVYLPYGRSGVTIKDINVQGFSYGIYLQYSSGNTLTANTASNNSYGIYLSSYSHYNTLTGNTTSNNSYGIYLSYPRGNTLTGNTASNNGYGIRLHRSRDGGNTLTDNTTLNNGYGIYLNHSSNNTLTGNTTSNNGYGIYISRSRYNQIYNNNFIDNTAQAYVYSGSANVFNLDRPIGGNYWSNWTSPDNDGDGFVDNPYVIAAGVQDNLPWTRPFGGFTPAGTEIVVVPVDGATGETPVTLTFENVTEPGMTTLSCTAPGENQGPPSGFKVGQPPTIFDISTTAVFEGEVQVCIDYSGISFGNESNLKFFHLENGHWVEVPTSLDTENKIICGTVMSLSFFGIFELENQPPEVTINSPASGLVHAVNTPIDFVGTIIDPDTDDTHTATWTISNENWPEDIVIVGSIAGNIVSNPVEFVDAGIYSIKLTVTDEAGASGEATTVNNDPECPAFIVIYDPSAGFVTGGGWIYSPIGALLDSAAEGKASFGFVAKYKKGATVPTGNTEFRFRAGGFSFKSSSYEWLVVAGKKAMFKGEGSIDGMDGSFKFMLTGVDDTEDKFRIKISDPASEDPIYDNKRGEGDAAEPTTIGGGSIVIHGG